METCRGQKKEKGGQGVEVWDCHEIKRDFFAHNIAGVYKKLRENGVALRGLLHELDALHPGTCQARLWEERAPKRVMFFGGNDKIRHAPKHR